MRDCLFGISKMACFLSSTQDGLVFRSLRAHLHQASASTLRQLCNEACDSVLIENNRVAPEWGCNPFSSDSTDFNENRITSVITELLQR